MTQAYQEPQQEAFAGAVAHQLRAARLSQKLTQAGLAARTGGRISKAALANYETRQRSLRIDVFWVLVRALDIDAAALLAAAERESGYCASAEASPIVIDIRTVQASDDARLAAVKRWFALRLPQALGARGPETVTLDGMAINALAQLMGTTPADCRTILIDASRSPSAAGLAEAG